ENLRFGLGMGSAFGMDGRGRSLAVPERECQERRPGFRAKCKARRKLRRERAKESSAVGDRTSRPGVANGRDVGPLAPIARPDLSERSESKGRRSIPSRAPGKRHEQTSVLFRT